MNTKASKLRERSGEKSMKSFIAFYAKIISRIKRLLTTDGLKEASHPKHKTIEFSEPLMEETNPKWERKESTNLESSFFEDCLRRPIIHCYSFVTFGRVERTERSLVKAMWHFKRI